MKLILFRRDKGVALLLSLIMLAIFLTMAVAFILFSGSMRAASIVQRDHSSLLVVSDHLLDEMRTLMEHTMAPIQAFDSVPDDYYMNNAIPKSPMWSLDPNNETRLDYAQSWANPCVADKLVLADGSGDVMDITYLGRASNITNTDLTAAQLQASVKKALTFTYANDQQVQFNDPKVGWISTAVDAPTGMAETLGYFYYTYAIIPLENQYNPNMLGPKKSAATDTRVHGAGVEEVSISNFYDGDSTPNGMDLDEVRDTHWESLQHLQSALGGTADDTAMRIWFPDLSVDGQYAGAEKVAWDQSSVRSRQSWGNFPVDGQPLDIYGNDSASFYRNSQAYSKTFTEYPNGVVDLKALRAADGGNANRLVYEGSDPSKVYGRLRYLRMPMKSATSDNDDNQTDVNAAQGEDVGGGYNVDPRVAGGAVYANINDFMDADSIATTTRDLKADFSSMGADAFDWTKDDTAFYTYLGSISSGMSDPSAFIVGLEAAPYFRQLKTKFTRRSAITDPAVGGSHTFDLSCDLEWAQMYPAGNPGRVTSFDAEIKVFYSYYYDNLPLAPAATENAFTAPGANNWELAQGMVSLSVPGLSASTMGLSGAFGASNAALIKTGFTADQFTGSGSAYTNNIHCFQAIAVVLFKDASGNLIDWAVTPPIRRYNLTKNKIMLPGAVSPDEKPTASTNGVKMDAAGNPTVTFSWEAIDPRCNNYIYKPAASGATSHYPGAYDFVTARFSVWDLFSQENGTNKLKARSTLGAPSAIGSDPNTKPWQHLSEDTLKDEGARGLYMRSSTLSNVDYYGGTGKDPSVVVFDNTGDYDRYPQGYYLNYQGLQLDMEPYFRTGTYGYDGQSGANSWTAKVSTAYIKNAPFESMKELGLIGRGECFRTLNLMRGGFHDIAGNGSVGYSKGYAPQSDTYRLSSGITRGCNDRTLLHYLSFGDVYDSDKPVSASLLSVFERNPQVINAFMRDCYSANPLFDDPLYGVNGGRVSDQRALTVAPYFPCQWTRANSTTGEKGEGWDAWTRQFHDYGMRQFKTDKSTDGNRVLFYPGSPGFGSIMEIAQMNTFKAGSANMLYDAQAEGVFMSNYRLISPGHRYFMAVFNIRHAAVSPTVKFDPENYDAQAKMVVLFERITPPLDTAPITSRIIAKQLIME